MFHSRQLLSMFCLLLFLVAAQPARTQHTGPAYADDETRQRVTEMITAHGGMQAWEAISSIDFMFFTRNSGAPEPWLSHETIHTPTGRAYLDWPVLEASIVWNGSDVWSVNWPPFAPPGFFVNLTYAFVTLPWQTQNAAFRIESGEPEALPNDETMYTTVRLVPEGPMPTLPGTYYKLFIDPESHVLKGVEFDIAHPGMVANPSQPLGPNLHVFSEHRESAGLLLPRYYESYGFNNRNRTTSNAVHFMFDLSLNEPFDEARMTRPADAVVDEQTGAHWVVR